MGKKRWSNLGYYLKEGLLSVFRHGFMSFASIAIIVACLIIMGSFVLVGMNVNNFIDAAENQNQIVAFVDENLVEDAARAIGRNIEAVPNVARVQFVTRYDAWGDFLNDHEEDRFSPDNIDASALRHRFIIELDDIAYMEETAQQVAGVAGIDDIRADTDIAARFVTLRRVLTIVFSGIIAALFILSIFIIANTIKLTTFDRREEIAIMRMVGATKGFVRWPFVFQGFILGIVGAGLAFILQWVVYEAIAVQVMEFFTGDLFIMFPFSNAAELTLASFVGVGFAVGVLGSAITIRKYLKV